MFVEKSDKKSTFTSSSASPWLVRLHEREELKTTEERKEKMKLAALSPGTSQLPSLSLSLFVAAFFPPKNFFLSQTSWVTSQSTNNERRLWSREREREGSKNVHATAAAAEKIFSRNGSSSSSRTKGKTSFSSFSMLAIVIKWVAVCPWQSAVKRDSFFQGDATTKPGLSCFFNKNHPLLVQHQQQQQ